MKRLLIASVVTLFAFGSIANAQVRYRVVEPAKGEFKVIVGEPPAKADSNREIIELLKQVIQKLEAQNRAGAQRKPDGETIHVLMGLQKQIASAAMQHHEAVEEASRARAEFEKAKKRLEQANEKIHKLQEKNEPSERIEIHEKPNAWSVKIQDASKEQKRQALEKRLDQMLREIEQLKRELKK